MSHRIKRPFCVIIAMRPASSATLRLTRRMCLTCGHLHATATAARCSVHVCTSRIMTTDAPPVLEVRLRSLLMLCDGFRFYSHAACGPIRRQ